MNVGANTRLLPSFMNGDNEGRLLGYCFWFKDDLKKFNDDRKIIRLLGLESQRNAWNPSN